MLWVVCFSSGLLRFFFRFLIVRFRVGWERCRCLLVWVKLRFCVMVRKVCNCLMVIYLFFLLMDWKNKFNKLVCSGEVFCDLVVRLLYV